MRTRRGGPVILFEVVLLEEPLVGHEKGVSEYRDAHDETEEGLTREWQCTGSRDAGARTSW